MKFGENIQSNLYEPWRFYYLDYDKLKGNLKKEGMFNESDETSFVEFLERELDKVDSFHRIKTGEITRHVSYLKTLIPTLDDREQKSKYIEIEKNINSIISEVNELAKFTRINYSGFIKIVKKHDKYTHYSLKPVFHARIAKRDFFKQNYDNLLVQLSTLYENVRNQGKQPEENKNKAGGGAQNFIRRTTKYWVHPDNVMELKLFILRNLPVLVYNSIDGGDVLDSEPAITSIYFDNDEFDLYKGRLEKSEGAEAIRLRWYGGMDTNEIFIERKTHQEDWTGEKSVKERFSLKEKYVNSFLKGDFKIDKLVNKLRLRGTKTEMELQQLTTLANEIQDRILDWKLKPKMRSFYNRTAFQLPGDAKVRISLDTELTLVREDNNITKKRSGNNWRRTDIGTDWPFEKLGDDDACRFPYAILEVKLQTQYGTEPPEWVENVPKFSKFIHGVASLLEDHVQLLPFWLPQIGNDIRKNATKEWGLFKNQGGNKITNVTFNTPSNVRSKSADSSIADHHNTTSSDNFKHLMGNFRSLPTPNQNISDQAFPNGDKRIKLPTRIEPKVFFANERTFLSWLHFAVILATLSLGLLNFGDKVSRVSAVLFIFIASLFMFYAAFLFQFRAHRIRNRESGPYDDRVGPMILVIGLFAAISVNFYLKVHQKNGTLPLYLMGP